MLWPVWWGLWHYKSCLENAWMRLSIPLSQRSRRAVPNGGPYLSVAHDLTCFIKLFERINNNYCRYWMREAMNGTVNQISSSCAGWWSSDVSSLRSSLVSKFLCVYKLCLETAWLRKLMAPSIGSWREWCSKFVCSSDALLFHKSFAMSDFGHILVRGRWWT